MSYRISSRDYLSRAREQLALSTSAALFYAAFELRAGVEARMLQYLEAQQNVSEKLKRGWRIAVLGEGIDRTFKLGDKLARFSYQEADGSDEVFVLYYTPVSKELQRNAKQLGIFYITRNDFVLRTTNGGSIFVESCNAHRSYCVARVQGRCLVLHFCRGQKRFKHL